MSPHRPFWSLPSAAELAHTEAHWLRRIVYPALRRAYPHVAKRRASQRRKPLPEALLEEAQVPGYRDIRFWGDVYSSTFEQTLIEKDQQVLAAARAGLMPEGTERADFLSLSGGGDRGAFAAGLLNGWSARGDRPVFEAVTGVSAGALAAPFAFLGTECDQSLREIYTEKGAADLFTSRGLLGFFGDALNDTTPLETLIRHYATDDFLDRVGAEHRKGRRLFVMTTNLDAQRPVIWNLSAVAASDRPDRRDLFVSVLRASSALPGLFPPVKIDVTTPDGTVYDELHVDGGVTAELIFVPPESRILTIEDSVFDKRRRRSLYVVENGKLGPEYKAIDTKLLSLTARAVATLVKYQVIDNLLALSVIMKSTEGHFFFNAVPAAFEKTPAAPFDLAYAQALFEAGREVGETGHWFTTPPLSPTHGPLDSSVSVQEAAHRAMMLMGRRAGADAMTRQDETRRGETGDG